MTTATEPGELARLAALGGRRSAGREVLLPFRTSRDTSARLDAVARAAGMSRQVWIEATLLAAIPPSLHAADTQEPLDAA